jgi:hypothetical protein
MHHERVIFFGRSELARSQPADSHRTRPGARDGRASGFYLRPRTRAPPPAPARSPPRTAAPVPARIIDTASTPRADRADGVRCGRGRRSL